MRNQILHLRRLFTFKSYLIFLLLVPLAFSISAQELPNKIRGYKVHRAKILIQTADQPDAGKREMSVVFDSFRVEIGKVSIIKTVWDVTNEITVFGQSGEIDFITFKDFKINGNNVEIEEYRHDLSFRHGEKLFLAKPIRINLGNLSGLKAATREFTDSKEKWQIEGRVFVFGKFKKSLFKFKRVIPIDIDLEISNPLKTKKKTS